MADTEHLATARASIDRLAAALRGATATTAGGTIARILDVVQATTAHEVRDHAYKVLRNAGRPHLDDDVQRQLRQALGVLEELAQRPAVAPEAPPAPPEPPPSAPPPPTADRPAPRPDARPSAPPAAPPLCVTTMVPGRRYRIVNDFTDFDGTPFVAGTVLTFVSYSYFPYDGGYTIHFAEAGMRLAEIRAEDEPVLANDGQRYFAPADPG